ncbi:hypothetical protein PG913_01010 [Tenacibaculum pacificus]|uniref:hypothetical protein n=1 Tax=Tenacibaculum pacificus TaxID=3018314 RepID=UPI0022F3B129|nr:hypothetical protein [Tenacibaculum pacificus]WBX73868.1 hypothetical protein PG913_01010 [Tenacibaculum pacificus]
MHKKLASDLTSLAHSILQMKNKDDVFELKHKAYEVYEKLSVLVYIEEYINNTPNPSKTKEELLEDVLLAEENRTRSKIEKRDLEISLLKKETVVYHLEEEVEEIPKIVKKEEEQIQQIIEEVLVDKIQETPIKNIVVDTIIDVVPEEKPVINTPVKEVEEIIEQPFDEISRLLSQTDDNVKNDVKDIGEIKNKTLEEELHGTISVDIMADLFEKVTPKKSLNDLLQTTIQIDLNDRIVFVRHLFDGNQNDFNRVISQLNTFKTEKEAKRFINNMIKPDYDWSNKEIHEARLFEIIERRFA